MVAFPWKVRSIVRLCSLFLPATWIVFLQFHCIVGFDLCYWNMTIGKLVLFVMLKIIRLGVSFCDLVLFATIQIYFKYMESEGSNVMSILLLIHTV